MSTTLKEYDSKFPLTSTDPLPILVNEFTESSGKSFCEEVIKRSIADENQPIIINIDSYGGYVDSLAQMLNTLDSINNPIITVCIGKAMSCGSILLSHGDYRFAAQHSRTMVHETLGGSKGNVNDILTSAEEMDRLNKHFMGVLAANCGKTLEELLPLMRGEKRDLYMDAKASLDFGLIDYIGTPLVTKKTKFSLTTK